MEMIKNVCSSVIFAVVCVVEQMKEGKKLVAAMLLLQLIVGLIVAPFIMAGMAIKKPLLWFLHKVKHQVTEAEVEHALRVEIEGMDWHGYTVSIESTITDEAAERTNCGKNPFGIQGVTNAMNKEVVFYTADIAKLVNAVPMLTLSKAITTVRHENRHVQQFCWLQQHGLLERALMNEVFSLYGSSTLEKDAVRYQKGKEDDLNTVLSEYAC